MEAQEFKSDQYVRFCPGCGDHAICMALQKAMAQIGVPRHKTAVISGIGCSSRMPHYLNTYGFNTIHGRGAAIATGVKTSHPELTVWQMTGDGDCLAIGGNHFIHSLRRNVDLNICLFNNRIYGLTKGQYSPTSPKGFVSKSSPFGTVERPFIPAELVMGARGTFFARTLDVDMPTTVDCMVQAHQLDAVVLLASCDKKFKEYEAEGCQTYFNKKDHLWTLYEYETGEFTIPENAEKGMIYGGCNCGACHITILPTGDIYACRRVADSKVGNVFEDRIADVWLSSMECYRDFDKFSKCSRCKLLAWCRGCPAVAKGTYGDFYADDPQCWASEENGLLRSVDK